MGPILDLFNPSEGVEIWGRNTVALVVGSLTFVWLLALILAHVKLLAKKDAELRVHFAWLAAFTTNALLGTVLLLGMGLEYRALGISLAYCLPCLLLVVLSGLCGLSLSGNVERKLARIKREEGRHEI
jgi:hypothetical protein